MRWMAVIGMAGLLVAGSSAMAGSPREPGMAADTCSVCHGNNGIAETPWFPSLAAQDKDYLTTQLQNFRNRSRADHYGKAYMWNLAGTLSDKAIAELSAYYAALPAPKPSSHEDPALVAEGKTIFEKGIDSESVPACGACHGPSAAGTSIAPRLAGQHSAYLLAQLKAFRSNERDNAVMHSNVQNMTDEQMQQIAAYLASL